MNQLMDPSHVLYAECEPLRSALPLSKVQIQLLYEFYSFGYKIFKL